jgi:hypothetical protein
MITQLTQREISKTRNGLIILDNVITTTMRNVTRRVLLCVLLFSDPTESFRTTRVFDRASIRITEHALTVSSSQSSHETDGSSSLIIGSIHEEEKVHESTVSRQRRRLVQSAITVSSSALLPALPAVAKDPYLIPTPPYTKDLDWPLGKVAFSLLPLSGTWSCRATVQQEIVRDQVWTHDQIQGIVNVNVPVRQTVVKLQSGGLWVHNPVAPTAQLLQMMTALVQKHGPVTHIVLGSVALEHKATFGAFASHFPNAICWAQPGQWSFPFNLPISWTTGIRQRRFKLRTIPVQQQQQQQSSSIVAPPEWTSDFDFQVLGPFQFKSVGAFSETAFYHRSTKTLIVTDAVVSVTQTPPAILQEDPRALLYHARDKATDVVEDSRAAREKGWRRMVQFGLVFFPSQINVSTVQQAFKDSEQVPASLRNLGEGAIPGGRLYPWSWNADSDKRNFEQISQHGKLFCPPILTKLILDREPARTLEWVDIVSTRFKDMQRIIPCHLNNNIRVRGSREFSQAFDALRSRPERLVPQRALAEDLALLQKASDLLTRAGIVAPSQVCDGEPARQKGRFA